MVSTHLMNNTNAGQPRKRKDLEYKSIVRTRAQKEANGTEAHVVYMQIATAFYNKFGREPRVGKNVVETNVASYLAALRHAMYSPMGTELLPLLKEHMPWFEWRDKMPVAVFDDSRTFAVLVLLLLSIYYAFIAVSLSSTYYKLY